MTVTLVLNGTMGKPGYIPAGIPVVVPVQGSGSVGVKLYESERILRPDQSEQQSAGGGHVRRRQPRRSDHPDHAPRGSSATSPRASSPRGRRNFSSFVNSELSITFSADGTTLWASDNQGVWQFKTTASLADSTTGTLIGLNDLRTLGVPYDGQGSAVAVVDTGVDGQSPPFRGRVTTGTNIWTGGPGNQDLAQVRAGARQRPRAARAGPVPPVRPWPIPSTATARRWPVSWPSSCPRRPLSQSQSFLALRRLGHAPDEHERHRHYWHYRHYWHHGHHRHHHRPECLVQCPDHQPSGLRRLEVRCEPPLHERPGTSRQGRPRDRIDPRLRYYRDLHQRIHSLQAVSPDRYRAQEPVAPAPQAGHRSDRGVGQFGAPLGATAAPSDHGHTTGTTGTTGRRDINRLHRAGFNGADNASLGDVNGMSLPAVLNEVISVTGTYPFPWTTSPSTTPNDPPIGVIPNPRSRPGLRQRADHRRYGEHGHAGNGRHRRHGGTGHQRLAQRHPFAAAAPQHLQRPDPGRGQPQRDHRLRRTRDRCADVPPHLLASGGSVARPAPRRAPPATRPIT